MHIQELTKKSLVEKIINYINTFSFLFVTNNMIMCNSLEVAGCHLNLNLSNIVNFIK